jgi:hypothetical protein
MMALPAQRLRASDCVVTPPGTIVDIIAFDPDGTCGRVTSARRECVRHVAGTRFAIHGVQDATGGRGLQPRRG